MKFTLEINLPDAEVEQYGIDYVLPNYLRFDVANKIEMGRADAGIVRDGNGNRIGQWKTEDDPQSGVVPCPCCGDDVMVNDVSDPAPCDACCDAGCEKNGDGAYDSCERANNY